MTFTNRELAKNPSFPVAVAFLACPQCNYVAKSHGLTKTQVPCPKCGVSGVARHIFPDVSALKLLEMTEYFYTKACKRVEDLQTKLVNDLQEQVGQTYELQSAIKTAREIQDFYQKSGGRQAEYDRMLEIIRERLSLQSIEEAQKLFVPLFGYSDAFEEHKVVVILTCTLLEKLFKDLLVLIHICKGMDRSRAIKKFRKLVGFDKRCEAFKKIIGLSLEEAISQCPIPGFFPEWEEVRKARNKFVHKTPYAIGVSTAEKAFNLAKNAFSLFAYLQNRFCIRSTGACSSL